MKLHNVKKLVDVCLIALFAAATTRGIAAAGIVQGSAEQMRPATTRDPAQNSPSQLAISMPRPTAAQLAWQDAELGVMFHLDPRIFNGWGTRSLQAACRAPMKDPKKFEANFNPTKLDTDQWLAAAKALGAEFAILVVKHETGFCLWQSDVNPFCLKNVGWRNGKGDILRDFIASCRKYGIKPGIFTEARWNYQLGVYNFKVGAKSPLTQKQYNRLIEREVEELCTHYGKFFEIWWDGGILTPSQGGPDVLPIVEKHQPNMIFYHSDRRRDLRWGGSESGTVGYPCWSTVDQNKLKTTTFDPGYLAQGDANGHDWCPAMADAPFRCMNGRHDWFWSSAGRKGVVTLRRFQSMYYGSVGRNATLVLGLTPNQQGLIPAPDVARCHELGQWLRAKFGGKPLANTSGNGKELQLDIPTTVKAPVTLIVLQERIRDGERVRQFVVEAQTGEGWKRVCSGSCVGHERIVKIAPCDAREFRLHIAKSIAEPEIRAFILR